MIIPPRDRERGVRASVWEDGKLNLNKLYLRFLPNVKAREDLKALRYRLQTEMHFGSHQMLVTVKLMRMDEMVLAA